MTGLLTFALTLACNAVWQAPLLLAAGWLAARLYRGAAPEAAYRVWSLILALQVSLPVLCATAGTVPGSAMKWWAFLYPGRSSAGVTFSFGPASTAGASGEPWSRLTWAAAAYGAVLLVCSWRLLRALVRTWDLRRGATRPPLSAETYAVWQQYRVALADRRPTLLESPAVTTPLVIGIRQPCVMLPAGLMTALSAEEWAALLAHECAHIERRDFAKNLLWAVISLPLAWHPAVWRARGALAESREAVCDAVAARYLGTPLDYARALVRLATRLLPAPPVVSLHAIGMLDANALERRVMQLLNGTQAEGWVRRTGRVAVCGVLATVTCASAWAWRSTVAVPASSTAKQLSETSPQPVRVASGVLAGLRLEGQNPEYPADARAAHIEGTVLLSATISKMGEIENLQVVSGPEELRASALEAVKTWHYKPYVLNGEPAAVQTTISVNFQLND